VYPRPNRRRRFPIVLVLLGCLAIAFLSRHAFVGLLADFVLHRLYSKEQGALATFDSARWNGRFLSISNVEIETPAERVQIEKIELNLAIAPHVWFIRPHWTIKECTQDYDKSKMKRLFFLLRLIRFDAVEGRCTVMPSVDHLTEKRFQFSIESYDNNDKGMRLVCFKDSEALDAPFFESSLSFHKEQVDIEANSKAAPIKELIALGQVFFPSFCEQLETIQGLCSLDIRLDMDRKGQIVVLQGNLSASQFLLKNNIKGWEIGADNFEMVISSDNQKKRGQFFESEAAIAGGCFHLLDSLNEYRFVDLGGYFSWLKQKDPKFHLEGQLVFGKNTEAVLIDGKGDIDEQEGLRMDSQFSLGEKTRLIASGNLSLIRKLEEVAIDVQLQHAELPFLKHLSDVISWTQASRWVVHKGVVRGNGLFKFKQGELVKAELAPLNLVDADFENEGVFHAKSLTLSIDGKWHVLPEVGWQIKRFRGLLQSGSVDSKKWERLGFHQCSGECHIEQGQIEESTFKARVNDMPIELEVCGSWKSPSANLFASTNWNALAEVLSSCGVPIQGGVDFKEGIEIVCEFTPISAGYNAYLQVLTGSDGKLRSNVIFSDQALQKGSLKVSNLPISLLCSSFFPSIHGTGFIDAEGNFDAKGGITRFSLNESEWQSPDWVIETATKIQGELTWGYAGKDMKIQVPLHSLHCHYKQPYLDADCLSAMVIATNRAVEVKGIEMTSYGISFKGDAQFKDEAVKLTSKEIRGKLSELQDLLTKIPDLPQLPKGSEGKFLVKDQDFKWESSSGIVFLRAHIDDLLIPFGQFGSIDCGSTKIHYNSQKGLLCFDAMQMDFFKSLGVPFRVEVQPIELRKKGEAMLGTVSGAIKSDSSTILDAWGQLTVSSNEIALHLDPSKSQLFGSSLEKAYFQRKDKHIQLFLDGVCQLEQALPLLEPFQKDASFSAPLNLIGQCAYQLGWDSQTRKWEGSLKSRQLEIEGKQIENVHIQMSKDPNHFCLEKAEWDDFDVYAEITLHDQAEASDAKGLNEKSLPFIYHFKSPKVLSHGEGSIDLLKRKAKVLPSFKILSHEKDLVFRPNSPILLDFSTHGEVLIKEARWNEIVSRSSIEIPELRWNYRQGKVDIETAKFKISSLLTKKWLPHLSTASGWFQGSMHCHRSPTTYEIEGGILDGKYGWDEKMFHGKAIQFRWIPHHLLIGAKTQVEQNSLIGTFQLDLNDQLALLKVQNQNRNTNLDVLFRVGKEAMPMIEKFSGECLGIRADLKKSQGGVNSLVGEVAFDFGELLPVLPAKTKQTLAKMKLGGGFFFQGRIQIPDFLNWKAEGTLRGDECVLFNTIFGHLESHVSATSKQLLFKQITLKEGALSAAIPQIKIEVSQENKWVCDCPLLQIKELQPSLLRPSKGEPKPVKPFTIRNLTVSDIHGECNSVKSFKGNCLLQFTNGLKKESHILDIPLNMLKDLGLEPSVLVPIQGELVGHLQQGKLHFTELKGAYSEGRRTHFILAGQDNSSYVDLDGKLHIDLIMRQAVMLKIAESLTLGIRGTLEKPRYLLLP
jgi:hypothetical protein